MAQKAWPGGVRRRSMCESSRLAGLMLLCAQAVALSGCVGAGTDMKASLALTHVCPTLSVETPTSCVNPDNPAETEPDKIYDKALGIEAGEGAAPVATPRVKAIRETLREPALDASPPAGTAEKTPAPSAATSSAPPAKAVADKPASPIKSRPVATGTLANLQDSVAHAVLTFPEVKIVEARVEEARAGVKVASAALMPTVEGSLQSGPNYDGAFKGSSLPYTGATNRHSGRMDAGLVLRQLVFDFGATQSDVERASFLRDSERHKLRDKIDEVAYKTAQVYARILELRAIDALIRDTINAHLKLLEIVKAQAEEGHGTVADVNRIKSRLVDVNAMQSDISLQLHGAEDQFERLTRKRPGSLASMPDLRHLLPKTAETAIAEALVHNPKLAGMVAARNSVEKELEFQKASYLPRISLEANADSKNYRGGANGSSDVELKTMLAVRFKIFDGGLNKATEEQIQARIKGNEMGLLNEREQMEADLRQAYRAITSAAQKGRLLGSGVQAASSVRELYLEQFKGGKRTIFELLDSQMSYYTARRSQIEAQYEVARASYDVLRNTGELTRVLANMGGAPKKTPPEMAKKK